MINSNEPAFSLFGNRITSATVIEGFTIINGETDFGGTIDISNASPIIRCNRFIDNVSLEHGAAIYIVFSGNPVIKDNVFNNNTSTSEGGAIYIAFADNVQPSGNEFMNNSAGEVGGAIYGLDSTIDIDGDRFVGNGVEFFGGAVTSDNSIIMFHAIDFLFNSAGVGGGALAGSSGSAIFADLCYFGGNTAGSSKESGTGDGGAMFNLGIPATIIDCIFEDNTATRGGAIYNSQTNLQSTNCLFFGNTATSTGGAIYNSQSQPQIRLATMWGNSAISGGGLYNVSSFPNISNSILDHNSPEQIRDIPSSITTVTYSNIQGGWPGDGNISQTPMFVDPSNGDFNLAPGSPCIDAGNNAAVPIEIKTDLAGNPRFVDDPDTKDTGLGDPPLVDMGALEFQVILPCPWDLNGDGTVNTSDLLALFAQWGTPGSADFDGSGVVNTTDLLILFANWGLCK